MAQENWRQDPDRVATMIRLGAEIQWWTCDCGAHWLADHCGYEADLVERVHRLARSAGLTVMPEVGIYESPELNAFATGPTKNRSLVAVSTGLLDRMSADELDGVLAHEISHVANGDMVTLTLIQGVVNAFVMFLARVIAFAIAQAMRDRDDERGGGMSHMAQYMVTFVLEMIFMVLEVLFTLIGLLLLSER
jgi:heat shock protein HtpX